MYSVYIFTSVPGSTLIFTVPTPRSAINQWLKLVRCEYKRKYYSHHQSPYIFFLITLGYDNYIYRNLVVSAIAQSVLTCRQDEWRRYAFKKLFASVWHTAAAAGKDLLYRRDFQRFGSWTPLRYKTQPRLPFPPEKTQSFP